MSDNSSILTLEERKQRAIDQIHHLGLVIESCVRYSEGAKTDTYLRVLAALKEVRELAKK